jgi:ankyrin repeat protein
MSLAQTPIQKMADGTTPLLAAVQQGNLDAMRCLVMEHGADATSRGVMNSLL